jgi:aconitase A
METILLEKFSTYLKMTDIVLKVNNIFEVNNVTQARVEFDFYCQKYE